MTSEVFIGLLDEIPDGDSKGVLPDARGRATVVVVRQGQQAYAYHNICPHYGQSRLGWKKDAFLNGDKSRLICAAHGALFRIEDGYCETGPCLGDALARVRVRISDGRILAQETDLPDARPTRAHAT